MPKKIPPIVPIGAGLLIAGGVTFRDKIPFIPKAPVAGVQVYGNEKNLITVLGDTFSGYSTFRNDRFATTVTNAGLGIQYSNEFDQGARAKALGQSADVIVTSLDQVITHQPDGKIVGVIDTTKGADAVVLNTRQYPGLKSLSDLQAVLASNPNAKIVYSGDTPSEYLATLLNVKFDSFDLNAFQHDVVAESTIAYEKLLADPDVVVAVLWEPFVKQAVNQGNTKVLSSKDVPNAIIDVIVASNDLIKNRPNDLKQLLGAYYAHMEGTIAQSQELKAQIADDGGLSANDAAAVIQGIEFFDSVESQRFMREGKLAERIDATGAVLQFSGKVASIPAANSFLDANPISAAASSRQAQLNKAAKIDPSLAGKKKKVVIPQVTAAQIKAAPEVGNVSQKLILEFQTGSATLTAQGNQALDALAAEIKEFNPETLAVEVIGHTSKTGSAEINNLISRQRAAVVVKGLESRGVTNRITPEGKGFYLPLSGIDPTDPRQQRTEVKLKRIGS